MSLTRELSKYGGVAGGSAVADYAVFSVLLFFGAGVMPAQMFARISGGVFSFFANKYWSFKTKGAGTIKTEGRRFMVLYAFSYVLALLLLYLLTKHAGVGPYPAKITVDVTCFMLNFLVMRSYVFGSGLGLRLSFRHLWALGVNFSKQSFFRLSKAGKSSLRK